MIILTRADGNRVAIHAGAIERIEEIGPQTMVFLGGIMAIEASNHGTKYIVTDSIDDVLEMIELEYKLHRQADERSY